MAKKTDVEMYLTNNAGKSAVAEQLIRTLKNKIYKYMTSVSTKCLYRWITWYS